MDPTVHYQTTEVCFATWKNVFLTIWLEKGSPSTIAQTQKHFRQQYKLLGSQPVASVTIARSNSIGMVDEESRRIFGEIANELQTIACCTALVLPREGFGSSVIRGILTGIALVQRHKLPNKIFDTPELAFEWTAQYLPKFQGETIASTEVIRAFQPLIRTTHNG